MVSQKVDRQEEYDFPTRLRGKAMAGVLRLLRSTWRIRTENMETFDKLYRSRTPFILCFWHGKYIPVLPLFEGYRACVLTSLSARGDVIAVICNSFGYDTAQVPDRGGGASLNLMMERLSKSPAGAIAVDGPLGPYHLVKKGVPLLASAIGYSLLPVSLELGRKWIQKKRWDRMEVPVPLSTLALAVGEPIEVPEGLSPGEAQIWADRLGDSLMELDIRASGMLTAKPGRGKGDRK